MNNDKVIDLDRFNSQSLKKLKGNSFVMMIVIFVIIVTLMKSILIVGAGKRVVVFNSFIGVESRALGEGIHFLVPYIQTPFIYDVRTLSYTMAEKKDEGNYQGDDSIECLTSDGQKVGLDLSLIYALIADDVWKMHQQVGPEYMNKVIRPTIRSVARNTIASYAVIELYSNKRLEVQQEIFDKVKRELAKYHITTAEVLIRNVKFSEEFSKAIEQKQVALQEAERMRYVLEKEKREKERKIIEAEGEAESIRKKAAALKANPQLIQYEYVSKIAPGVKTIITNQNSIMNLPSELFKND